MSTPAEQSYRMPAEWEPHRATWLAWPRPESAAFRDQYETAQLLYTRLISELVTGEEVHLLVWDQAMETRVKELLEKTRIPRDRVWLHLFPAYEPWCRAYGPVFVARDWYGKRERAILRWRFNAWGDKYQPHDLEEAIPQQIARCRELPMFTPDMVLEGGAIDVNGCGCLLAAESCLFHRNRNPELGKQQIHARLKEHFNADHFLWLDEGLVGDETDGHVDQLARFLNRTTIAVAHEENIDDANYLSLQENLQRLRTMRDQKDHLFRIVKLPMPGLVEYEGQRMPASYLNFYIANRVVLAPTFRHRNDAVALKTLQKEFPDRRVVGMDVTKVLRGFGSLHALALQEPA